jgi:tRNA pseudouridine55 synthase
MINFQPGFILLDKEIGISSAKALYPIKKLIPKGHKVGHAGTLDPFASGLLVVAVGKATKALQYVVGMSKTYEFIVKWGESTDTDDLTGKIINQSTNIPSLDSILNVVDEFHGAIQQQPPKYSAIHVNGKRAYDLARDGIEFTLPKREVHISSLSVIDHTDEYTTLVMECGKGCYVRSVANDIASKLNTYAHVTALRRTKIGSFRVEKSSSNIIPILDALNGYHREVVSDTIAKKIINGVVLKLTDLFFYNHTSLFIIENLNENLIAICHRVDDELKIHRIT